MAKKQSIKKVVKKALTEDSKAREIDNKSQYPTIDSFVNFAMKLGIGADNATSANSYGFNPITRNRTLLEWAYRGSWLAGAAVDCKADDMTRSGVTIKGELDPGDIEKIQKRVTQLQIWNRLNETVKWSNLYGGCLAILLIDGQDYKTPLRVNTVGKGQFKGLLVLDRWMLEPSLSDLVTDEGTELGLPKYYTVNTTAPALTGMKIHHSRCIRLEGISLPYWQRLTENMWGISVLERLYDRMTAYDSATTGASQLVYKAYLRTYKINGLREIIAAGGPALTGLTSFVELMRRFQGIEGITLIDGEDEFEAHQHGVFSGLSEVLKELGQQIAGALGIPLVRLFGQSPSGFNSGDSDIRQYYDSVRQKQEDELLVPITIIYNVIAQSEGIKLPDNFELEFNPLWQLSDLDKSTIAQNVVNTIVIAQESGIISDKIAMQELKQSSHITNIFSNITDDDINKASEELEPPAPEVDPLIPKAEKPKGFEALNESSKVEELNKETKPEISKNK